MVSPETVAGWPSGSLVPETAGITRLPCALGRSGYGRNRGPQAGNVFWRTIEGGDSPVDRPPLEGVAGETSEQVQMKMRDGVPVDLVVHLRGLRSRTLLLARAG
jgi:hypothetical protein